MAGTIRLSIGQYSDKGRKDANQDFYGACVPDEPLLSSKGIAIAIADGISCSEVSHVASHTAVTAFLDDYYCTSEAWSVKTSAERVLAATNSWLYSQTMRSQGRYDKERGYVCTFSAIVFKATTAHLFHVGDTRIYQVHGNTLEQLTCDHRLLVAPEQSCLCRAMGIDQHLEIDYRTVPVEEGDLFLLATDGVYEHVDPQFVLAAVHGCAGDLDRAAQAIVEQALRRGSADNLTLQIVKVERTPNPDASAIARQRSELRMPPILDARMEFEGYRILREIHASNRSHIYLALDAERGDTVVIKTPSIDLQGDSAYLERFLMEEWIARRVNSAHVLKPCARSRKRSHLYVAMEFIEGQTLAQWMRDNPRPGIETVRGIVEQIAKGLRAFHRLEMLHQDLRPENIMIDLGGTVKIIDFGSTCVAGIAETAASGGQSDILGTLQYTAPERFVGEQGTPRADLFSLGVITYQMLTGRLPYGAQAAQCRTRSAQRKLRYRPALEVRPDLPAWVDGALRKAVHPQPDRRYEDLPEYLFDLRHPNQAFANPRRQPLIERDPLIFWKSVSLLLAVSVVILLGALHG